jgi:hypothetical protein
MTQQRAHTHAHATPDADTRDHDLSPGRGNRAAQLVAPAHPLISGLVQRRARDANGVAEDAEPALASAASGTGHALPDTVLRKFETSLGADLSSVRVHTGVASQVAAESVGAKAYTVGQDIHFGAGHYDPTSAAGQHLLAHEVAHTVQQHGGVGRRPQFQLEVSTPTDRYELEADRAADAMITGAPTRISSASGVSRAVLRKDDDVDVKALPAPPSFSAADGSFAAMVQALDSSMKGGAGALAVPAGIAASQGNLSKTAEHARASEIYYKSHASKLDPANFNAELGAGAAADMAWAINMLSGVRVAGSATATWISLANNSNDTWSDVTKLAESLSIEVNNKSESNPLAALDGKQHAPTKGDQQVNRDEVRGEGMSLAVAAKKAGVTASPDTTGYKLAMQAYTRARDQLANKERKTIGAMNQAKQNAIQKKKAAATEEKEKWEAIAKAVDTFATGVTLAIGAGGALEGELGSATVTDPGSQSVTVVSNEGKPGFGIQDGTAESIVQKKETEAKGVAEKGGSVLSKVIQLKIAAINQRIAVYDGQISAYTNEAEVQKTKADVDEYCDSLADLGKLAKNVEDQRDLMEKKLLEWAKSIDVKLAQAGKAPADPKANQQSAMLLAKIRTASVATDGAIEGLSQGSAGLPKLYGDLARAAQDKQGQQAGRGDKRAAVFAIEGGRWSAASAAISTAGAALQRRKDQLATLETEFLATFARNSGGADGPSSPGTKF